ncbi:unnamed protein product [Psylliodes chrysocephalus]|uniref:Uncharacterized protein n=1 Tax=Psylliodes chrysocephalus TaxID=3402493 RepID=A0A9P0D1L8_9CUCU|nr:unnamed protein product [Psylliodes chrysocephala]
MPHVSSSGGDDLGSTDEVKVFKDEGDGEDEKRSSENLTEEKSSLIDLTESEEKSGGGNYNSIVKNVQRPDHSPVFGTDEQNVDETIIKENDAATVDADNKSERKTEEKKTEENPTTIIEEKHDEEEYQVKQKSKQGREDKKDNFVKI